MNEERPPGTGRFRAKPAHALPALPSLLAIVGDCWRLLAIVGDCWRLLAIFFSLAIPVREFEIKPKPKDWTSIKPSATFRVPPQPGSGAVRLVPKPPQRHIDTAFLRC
jgi:hypothetical protein